MDRLRPSSITSISDELISFIDEYQSINQEEEEDDEVEVEADIFHNQYIHNQSSSFFPKIEEKPSKRRTDFDLERRKELYHHYYYHHHQRIQQQQLQLQQQQQQQQHQQRLRLQYDDNTTDCFSDTSSVDSSPLAMDNYCLTKDDWDYLENLAKIPTNNNNNSKDPINNNNNNHSLKIEKETSFSNTILPITTTTTTTNTTITPIPPPVTIINNNNNNINNIRHSTKRHKQNIHLWQFLRRLLDEPLIYKKTIRWVDEKEGIFKIDDSQKVAELWGKEKHCPKMNYDKLSRSIRTYYKKNIIVKPPNNARRLVYQFCLGYR